MSSKKAIFSKTGYIKGKQCLKALYLYKHHYSFRDPIPAERLMRFSLGNDFGILARKLFPDGRDATPSHVHRYSESVALTKKLIQDGITTIYEAAFLYQGILIYADILTKLSSGWALYEVKSSAKVSNVYQQDLALQFFVIKGSGLDLRHASILHLNEPLTENYKDQEIESLCQISDFTEYCHETYSPIQDEILEMKTMLAGSRIPTIQMGPHCHDPYTCDFIGFCTQQVNPPNEGLFKD
ncbi:MAG: hypothetical protein KA347_03265 [Bacteroidia bacterium]|jgi:hypothetical protein|nr:hypothetical protein [Bacteroidota bacterium]MBP6511674.1 hypothetical protein [Bacteroidia bacterium]MBP7244815.1 hypothetical protein [Bacteroidia bacterium]